MSSLISRSNLFEDFFKEFSPGFFIKPLQGNLLPSPVQIRMDVHESDAAYTVEAEVPGVAKNDIHVTLDRQSVTLKAEVQRESSRSDQSCLHSERHYGAVSRTLTLPCAIDSQKAKAHYDKGVLTLTLPKSSPSSAQELAIE